MCDDESSDKEQQNEMSPIELVEEFYRLSDWIVEAQTDDGTRNVSAVQEAKKRLNTLVSDQTQIVASPESQSDHGWMLGVLEDLWKYAASKGLTSLECDLLLTRTRFESWLRDKQ